MLFFPSSFLTPLKVLESKSFRILKLILRRGFILVYFSLNGSLRALISSSREKGTIRSQQACTAKKTEQQVQNAALEEKSDLPVSGSTSLNMCTPQCLQKALRVSPVLKTRYERLSLPFTTVWSPCR